MLLGRAHGDDESGITGQMAAYPFRSEAFEDKGIPLRLKIRHWVLPVVGMVSALGFWLVSPGLPGAIVAGVFGAWLAIAAAWAARVGPVLVAIAGLVATAFALDTSGRVRAIERSWPDTRETFISQASGQLSQTLGAAVDRAQELATVGARHSASSATEAFAALGDAARQRGPESGVVAFDSAGVPRAWAGRHRLRMAPPTADSPKLTARINAFYVLLEARRQAEDGSAVSHVLLAADSAVPDREGSVAALFVRETGTALEFYAPGRAPAGSDVFDYCLPECAADDSVIPDTLFSVRIVPPTQGSAKLAQLAAGSRWVSALLMLQLVFLALVAGTLGRWLAVVGLAAVFVLTPAGLHVGLGTPFTSASYYLSALGPLTASAGALFVSSAFVVLLVVPWLTRIPRRRPWGVALGSLLVLVAPLALAALADPITPPVSEIGVGLWLSWELSLAMAGVAIGFVSAALMGGRGGQFTVRWAPWLAVGGAVGLGAVGMLAWSPVRAWPMWYVVLWLPTAFLAVLSRPRPRLAIAVTAVAGMAAVLLTWNATVRSRLLLAERDARRLTGGDPVAISMLERFAGDISAGAPPRTAADLYAHWRRSPLSADDYPAVLATWRGDGALLASLELAQLELSAPLFFSLARFATNVETPVIQQVDLAPGIHYIIAVPFPDSIVVTAGVAPRSRLIPPVRVARFLRGERRLFAPYEMSLGETVSDTSLSQVIAWRRDERWTVRGTRVLDVVEGSRHLHIGVPLSGAVPLLVRGTLVLLANGVIVALSWGLGIALSGGVAIPVRPRKLVRFQSYQSRLAVALAGFFIVPTLGFATWSAGRLRADAERSRDLLIQQTLSDAAGSARRLVGLEDLEVRERLAELGDRLGADLLWYERGVLQDASVPVLTELGLLDAYMSPPAHWALTVGDELEVTADELIGGQATRVGYRSLGEIRESQAVLAAPRLVDVQDLRREQEDLAFALLLVTIIGLGGAVGLATVAARSLSRPVESLRSAALAVGRGEPLPPFDTAEIPTEFASVVDAFERMAQDVEASQTALEAARRRTATVLKTVATGVVALDRDMRVTIANPSAGELLGAELAAGTDICSDTGGDWAPLWEWVETFLERDRELDLREFSVADRRIRAQVATLRSDPRGCVVALDDVTESARALRVLAWGELARQIAHEIKNPLTPIRLGVQHLQRARRDRRTDFDAALERTSRQILAEIERLDAIARAFSRFGAPPAEDAPLDTHDLVAIAHDAAELYELGGGANVRVEADRPVPALVRRDEVKEVLINLVENARDAGASEITIAVEPQEGDGVAVRVRDDGRGIAPDVLPRIFEPQFSTTTSGTGLGLAICKRLVESWGGTIEVQSVVGRGTEVRIHL